jgi:hypothetical protein
MILADENIERSEYWTIGHGNLRKPLGALPPPLHPK